ncbi:unnamed protein product [Paramecium primaurelia]|uniref:Uncharacterized protein n=1 Tax=Paramecium primaurelia TaxID=5886 RepID=A0A8S1LZ01_PARPR|nr:unnamed protein product [Paramecium primaurelia]
MKQQTYQSNVLQLAAQSSERIKKYINSNHNSSFVKSIRSGSIPLLNPEQHEFVNRTHDPNPPIYNKRYRPAKIRAQEAQDEFNNSHLKAGPYYNLPKNMRNEILAAEKMPMRYGKNPRTENERLQEKLENSSIIDHSYRNVTMIQRPNWKATMKEKWMSQDTFKSQSANFNSKQAWSQIPYRNPEDNYIYLESENSQIEFKRLRQEVLEKQGKLPFNPVIKKNPYTTYSTSIRTFKQDEAFGIQEKTMFSKNTQLKHYKSALISTKSVDHIMPYNHSNNIQAIKNIFPNAEKQYIKSSEQLGGDLNQKLQIQQKEEFPKINFDQQSPIHEYPQPEDFNNTNFEKTNFPVKKVHKPFKPYSEEEAKQIVNKYFCKQSF